MTQKSLGDIIQVIENFTEIGVPLQGAQLGQDLFHAVQQQPELMGQVQSMISPSVEEKPQDNASMTPEMLMDALQHGQNEELMGLLRDASSQEPSQNESQDRQHDVLKEMGVEDVSIEDNPFEETRKAFGDLRGEQDKNRADQIFER